MKKLSQVLQSKIFLILFGIVISINILLNYNKESIVDINSNYFRGVIEHYKIDGDKLVLQVKGKERIIANYYIKTKDEKEYLINDIKVGQCRFVKHK